MLSKNKLMWCNMIINPSVRSASLFLNERRAAGNDNFCVISKTICDYIKNRWHSAVWDGACWQKCRRHCLELSLVMFAKIWTVVLCYNINRIYWAICYSYLWYLSATSWHRMCGLMHQLKSEEDKYVSYRRWTPWKLIYNNKFDMKNNDKYRTCGFVAHGIWQDTQGITCRLVRGQDNVMCK